MGGSAAHKVKVPLSLCPKLAASNTRCEDRNRDKKTEGQTDKQTGVLKIQVACQLRIASYMNGLTDTKTQIMIDPVSPQFSCHKIHFVFNSHSRAAASCQPTDLSLANASLTVSQDLFIRRVLAYCTYDFEKMQGFSASS